MNSDALISLLRQVRASGKFELPTDSAANRWAAVHRVYGPSGLYDAIVRQLGTEGELRCFNEKMLAMGSVAIRVSHDELAVHLICRATEVGEDQAVDELNRYICLSATPISTFLVVLGLETETEMPLTETITLVPYSNVPAGPVNRYAAAYLRKVSEIPMSIGGPTFGDKTVVLRETSELAPQTFDADTEQAPAWSMGTLELVCECLTLLGRSTPMDAVFWTYLDAWVPFGLSLDGGWAGGPALGAALVKPYRLTPDDLALTATHTREYLALPEVVRQILRVALQRLNLSRRRQTLVDRAIDLGIALESVLLHDGGPDQQIALPFRLRGAWLLGRDLEHRRELERVFADIYACRCYAVHRGLLEDGSKIGNKRLCMPVRDLLNRGDDMCVEMITKLLRSNGLPSWNDLLLGGLSEHAV